LVDTAPSDKLIKDWDKQYDEKVTEKKYSYSGGQYSGGQYSGKYWGKYYGAEDKTKGKAKAKGGLHPAAQDDDDFQNEYGFGYGRNYRGYGRDDYSGADWAPKAKEEPKKEEAPLKESFPDYQGKAKGFDYNEALAEVIEDIKRDSEL